MNAAYELLKHIGSRTVMYVQISHELDWDTNENIEGTLEQVLPRLNFVYSDGLMIQVLSGTVTMICLLTVTLRILDLKFTV
jgi:hypothetical protein